MPRGVQNTTAMRIILTYIKEILESKSLEHQQDLARLGHGANGFAISPSIKLVGPDTRLESLRHGGPSSHNSPGVKYELDRVVSSLLSSAVETITSQRSSARNITDFVTDSSGVGAVVIQQGGYVFQNALRNKFPEVVVGSILIKTRQHTSEPELHEQILPPSIDLLEDVLLLDSHMASGGAALMAVKVLIDHGVLEEKISILCYSAEKGAVERLISVFRRVKILAATISDKQEPRWIDRLYTEHVERNLLD